MANIQTIQSPVSTLGNLRGGGDLQWKFVPGVGKYTFNPLGVRHTIIIDRCIKGKHRAEKLPGKILLLRQSPCMVRYFDTVQEDSDNSLMTPTSADSIYQYVVIHYFSLLLYIATGECIRSGIQSYGFYQGW